MLPALTFDLNKNTISLQIGMAAPDFSLYNTEKNKVSLSDFRGKAVLVLFFPLAFTGVCTNEMCSMRDQLAAYNSMNAEVLGISVDSLFTLGEFKKANNLNFTLLSDFNKTTAKAYGSLFDTFVFDMEGVARRSAFVIDAEGNIQYAEVLESAGDLPNFEAIQECLKSLQA
jgi:peroxiredoxin